MSESEPSYRKKVSAPPLTIQCPPSETDDYEDVPQTRPEPTVDYDNPNSETKHDNFNILKQTMENKLRNAMGLYKGQTVPEIPKPEMPLPPTGPPMPPPRPPRKKYMQPISEILDILWSVEDYTLKETFEQYKDVLPKVIMVTEGHYGEEEFDTFGKEQVLLLKGLSSQKRVIAEDDNEAMYSIPIQYPITMQVLGQDDDSGNTNTILRIEEIEKKFLFPVKVKFVENSDDTYFYSKTKTNVVRMGELRLIDVYEETYFLSHAVNQGIVFDQVLLLPLYLPLTLAFAEGFKPTIAHDWDHYFRFLRNSTAHINYDNVHGNKDISAYRRAQIQHDERNVYEFLQPLSFLKYENIAKDVSPPMKERVSIVYEELPDLPAHSPKTPKEQTHFFVNAADKGPNQSKDSDLGSANKFNAFPSRNRTLVPISPVFAPVKLSSPGVPKSKGNKFFGSEVAKVLPLRRIGKTGKNQQPIHVPDYNAPSPQSPGVYAKGHVVSPTQIPKDTGQLNTTELCECLKLLNLHRYVQKFIDYQIDGMLLRDLDIAMLQEDVGMNRLEATKIKRFAQGWRPQ